MNSQPREMFYEDGRTPKLNVDPRLLAAVDETVAENRAAAQRSEELAHTPDMHPIEDVAGQAHTNRTNIPMPAMPQVPRTEIGQPTGDY